MKTVQQVALRKALAGITGLLLLAVCPSADAQTTIRIPRIVNQNENQAQKPDPNRKPTPRSSGNPTFAYVGTPTLRRQAQESYLARIGKKSPSRAKMLAADFARNDPDKVYQSLIANTGLHNYEAADALAAYQLTGWIISNGIKTVPTKSRVLAARRQAAASLVRNPAMTNAAARGRAGEEFKLMTVTLHLGLLSARRSGQTGAYADEIAALFAETGPSPRTLALTDAGFVPRK